MRDGDCHNAHMDPRVARTKKRLHEAVLELAHEVGVPNVTVAAVTERANVNRSTFYQHYSDKDELLAEALDEIVESFVIPATTSTAMPTELTTYLQHVYDNAAIYRSLLSEHGSPLVVARLQERLIAIVENALTAAAVNPFGDLPVDVVAQGISGACLGVVRAWITRDPIPAPYTAATWLWGVIQGPQPPAQS